MTNSGQLVWTIIRKPKAIDDLFQIWLYLADEGEDFADRWIDRIDEGVSRLAEYPKAGSGRTLLADDLRVWPVPPYLVIYRLDEASQIVDVLRVVDGRSDVGKLLT
ncbi:type II toxin-antitoxin system RelE/ParE family toxin [Novosphingobium sp. MMS21-SN21R]|uniref:type II toxin-antitoxin system RelE/ParE family toxin n=1 Tax=Novosphingobium sp. MMS21-SN21R TaxID=2969298 RepID=UPI002885F8C0|nr:type II toxin-antitoxin system RelE/ParE family toxin [Novosphingobium sp. MMS21-SN21R]MDT0506705.1 type II toxin-antitoxin system RelE/ParE family toxin [Novosphingobium sp. MMS21-SN21R]